MKEDFIKSILKWRTQANIIQDNLQNVAMIAPIFYFLFIAAGVSASWNIQQDIRPDFPWDECVSMDQIVGKKCDPMYYICDYGDSWFTREVLCNNCIGDCPPGRVFSNLTETCVWPNTIGCSCTEIGQIFGTKCDNKYFVCKRLINQDWATDEYMCTPGNVFDPDTITCQPPSDIGC